MSQTLIEFTDHGQDFLAWVVDADGLYVSSWPLDSDVWAGLKVLNLTTLKAGDFLQHKWHGLIGTIKYQVKSVLAIEPVEVSVRMSGDGYVTSTVYGKRVSCTHDYEYPVKRLAEKLFPGRASTIERLECSPTASLHSKWRITPESV